ncbi:MAG: HNH endonuclease [Planctomycetota bacterium]
MNGEALELDRAAVRMARRQGAIEVALGDALARLFDRDGLIELGYSKQVDYARERLGVPPRTMYAWVKLARALRDRPLLHAAVEGGVVSPRKASAVAPLAVGDDEELWVSAAMRLPLRELESAVRAEGVETSSGYGRVESAMLRMEPADQDVLDQAIAIVKELEDHQPSRWQCVEIICQEWLSEFGYEDRESPAQSLTSLALTSLALTSLALTPLERMQSASIRKQLRAIEVVSDPSIPIESAVDLDARIVELMAARRAFDIAFGAVLARLVRCAAWKAVGYDTLEEYCRGRLGISARCVRERVWLERRMDALPELRAALGAGQVTYSKALTVARDATPCNVAERIEEASVTTWQQIERESTAREDRRNRALGVRRLWGPEDAMGTIADAIASARMAGGMAGLGVIGPGEALALIAAYFIRVYGTHPDRRLPARRRAVLLRHGGSCAVPGCSRAAQHIHHIEFRSQGGTDAESNLLGLCATHHLRGIHRGHMAVAGRAGERLDWRFGNGEEWVTAGADCVAARTRDAADRDGLVSGDDDGWRVRETPVRPLARRDYLPGEKTGSSRPRLTSTVSCPATRTVSLFCFLPSGTAEYTENAWGSSMPPAFAALRKYPKYEIDLTS